VFVTFGQFHPSLIFVDEAYLVKFTWLLGNTATGIVLISKEPRQVHLQLLSIYFGSYSNNTINFAKVFEPQCLSLNHPKVSQG